MTRTITTSNNYEVTYDLSDSGGITILKVKKRRRDITKEVDTPLKIRLMNEISEALEDEREALEWEAMQVQLDETKS